jgi:hypothetical protein
LIKPTGISGVKQTDEQTEFFLHVDIVDDFYKRDCVDEKEYPKDAWTVHITQFNDYKKGFLMSLLNEGVITPEFTLDEHERYTIAKYLHDNEIDKKFGMEFWYNKGE